MLLLMSVQEEEWDDVDLAIRQFQGMTQAIKFSPKPVVAAPFGLCLGGGTEISLHAAARQPHAELYTGWSKSASACCPAAEAARKCCCAPSMVRATRAAKSRRSRWPDPSR
jgi:3-hydroxyacyl-CoA dehydrogenase